MEKDDIPGGPYRTLLEQNRSLQDTVHRLKQQQQEPACSNAGSLEKLRRSKTRRLDRDSCPQQQQLVFDSCPQQQQQQQLFDSCPQHQQFDSPLLQTVDSLRYCRNLLLLGIRTLKKILSQQLDNIIFM